MAASQPSEGRDRFELAVPQYSRKIRTYARKQLRNRSLPGTDEADLENELLEVLWLCCIGYDPDAGAKFNTYFWTSAERKYLDLHKAASRQKRAGDYERVWLDEENVRAVVSEIALEASAEDEALARISVREIFRLRG